MGLEICNLRIQILAAKMTYFTKKFCLSQAPSPYRINFPVYFSIQYILILRESSKLYFIFSYFTAVFEKSAIISRQELSFNHILKECLISKDLQIIRKKPDTVLLSSYSNCTAENFKAIMWRVRGLELAKCKTLQPFEKIRQ